MRQQEQTAWHLPTGAWAHLILEDAFSGRSSLPLSETHQAEHPVTDRSDATRILVVDDEQLIADTLARILNLNGFAANAVYSGDAALATLDTFCPNIVLSDVRMPGRSGIEVGILIRQQCPDTRVVLFSGQAGVSALMDQARENGYGFELWPKPLHPRELVRRLREL